MRVLSTFHNLTWSAAEFVRLGMGTVICRFLPYLQSYSDTTLKCDLNVQNSG